MNLDANLLALLPPWYREVLDYQQLCGAEQKQFDALAMEINAVADNFFFQTMDASAVALWEQIFGIIPNPQTETLDFRRVRALNRVSTRPPYTMAFLRQKLDELIGPGSWTVSMDYPNYALSIESSAENQFYAGEVAYTIGKIKPAHIVFKNTPYLRGGLLLSERIGYDKRVYQYRLGAWGLGVSPFAIQEEGGTVKMPSTPSIQPALLNATAHFVSGDAAKARLNGEIIVEALTKTVSGSTLTITYEIGPDQADAVTKAELLDAQGTVLTSSAVYVPIAGPTIMKHVVPIAEGEKTNG